MDTVSWRRAAAVVGSCLDLVFCVIVAGAWTRGGKIVKGTCWSSRLTQVAPTFQPFTIPSRGNLPSRIIQTCIFLRLHIFRLTVIYLFGFMALSWFQNRAFWSYLSLSSCPSCIIARVHTNILAPAISPSYGTSSLPFFVCRLSCSKWLPEGIIPSSLSVTLPLVFCLIPSDLIYPSGGLIGPSPETVS